MDSSQVLDVESVLIGFSNNYYIGRYLTPALHDRYCYRIGKDGPWKQLFQRQVMKTRLVTEAFLRMEAGSR